MKVTFDEEKRQKTIEQRGLDFADEGKIFDGPECTDQDQRNDYPEPRFQTFGQLDGRIVMVAWTPTDDGIRVMSMRKCNERERRKFASRLE
jgi:uncharacterized protein